MTSVWPQFVPKTFAKVLDDVLVIAQSKDLLVQHRGQILSTLAEFGWMVNTEKSQIVPCQFLIYSGMFFDNLQYFFTNAKLIKGETIISSEALKMMALPLITVHNGMSISQVLRTH